MALLSSGPAAKGCQCRGSCTAGQRHRDLQKEPSVLLGTARTEAGCHSAPFLALLEMDVGKGVWRRGESRTRALGCVPRPATATSTEAGKQVSCADGKEQGSIREPELSVQQPLGGRVHPSPPSAPATHRGHEQAHAQLWGSAASSADGFWASSFPPSLGDKDLTVPMWHMQTLPKHNFWGHHEKTVHRHHHHAKDPAPSTLLMPGEAEKQDHGAEGLHGRGPPV